MAEFDPDKYLSQNQPKSSGEFDPDAYLSKQEPKSGGLMETVAKLAALHPSNIIGNFVKNKIDENPGALNAGASHFGNAAALGYVPQIAAATQPAFDKAADLVTGNNVSDSEPDYVQRRDSFARELARQKAEHPIASTVGSLAGTAAVAAPLGAISPISAATRVGRIGQSVLQNGAIGFAANPGDKEGEDPSAQLAERGGNALLGGTIGGVVQGGVEGLSAAGGFLSDKLKQLASERASRAIGVDKRMAKKLILNQGPDAVNKLGRTALDEGLISPLDTASRIAPKASEALDQAGEEIGNIIKAGDEAGASPISAKDLSSKLKDDFDLEGLQNTPGSEHLAKQLGGFLDSLERNGENLSLSDAHRLRMRIDKAIKWNKPIPEMAGSQPYLYEIRDALNKEIQGSLESSGIGDEGKKALLAANKRYNSLANVESAANNRAAGDAANRAIGLTDTISGVGGAHLGGKIGENMAGFPGRVVGEFGGAIAGGGINKVGRTYGPAMTATLADKASKAAELFPQLKPYLDKNPELINMITQNLKRDELTPNPHKDVNEDFMAPFRSNPALIDKLDNESLRTAVKKKLNRTPSDRNDEEYDATKLVHPDDAKQQFLDGN